MKKINLLLIFFLVSACTNSTKVVFLGDSITAAAIYDKEVAEPWGDTFIYPKATGFITLLKENVGDNVKLIGKGVSGDKVSDLLTRYKDDVIKLNPDIVIHTAALTNVDLCETNNVLANLINVQGTKNIVDGCMKIQSKIIFISTSYVFDGNSDQYFEEDLPNPTSYYGITKYESEKIIQNSNLDFLILRTDQPYCWIEKW